MIELILGIMQSLIFPVLVGWSMLILIMPRFVYPLIVTIVLSFALGLGVITEWMLILLINHLKLNLDIIIFPLMFLSLLAIYYRRKYIFNLLIFPSVTTQVNSSWLKKSLLIGIKIFIAYEVVFAVFGAMSLPMLTWDGIYAIAVKSKYFLFGGGLEGLKNFPGVGSYPIQMELCLTWIALNIGHWDDQLIKFIFPLMLIAYMILQYHFVNSRLGYWWATVSLALLMSAYFLVYQATVEYRAIFFMFYCIVSLFILCDGLQRNDPKLFMIAGFFSGISTFVKLEGSGHLALYILLISYFLYVNPCFSLVQKIKCMLWYALPATFINFIFFFVQAKFGLKAFEGRLEVNLHSMIVNSKPVFTKLFNNLFLSGNWNILWFVLVVSLVFYYERITKRIELKFFGLALVGYFLLYIVLGLFTSTFWGLFGDASLFNLSRTILHFFPLCPLMIVFLLADDLDFLKDHHDRQSKGKS